MELTTINPNVKIMKTKVKVKVKKIGRSIYLLIPVLNNFPNYDKIRKKLEKKKTFTIKI